MSTTNARAAAARRHSRTTSESVDAAVGLGLTVAGIVMAAYGLARSDESGIGPYGLITALHPGVLLGAMALGLAIAWLASRERRIPVLEWSSLVTFVAVLHGAPAVIESAARFPVAWLHIGFVDQIATNGDLLTNVDARFNWPGFFTSAAVALEATGLDPEQTLRWFPVLAEMLIVVLVVHLARALGASMAVSQVVGALYAVFDWVGQTYFAPQTFAWVLLLTVMIMALTGLPGGVARGHGGGLVAPVAGSEQRRRWWLTVLAIVLVVAAVSGSHQLTPLLLAVNLAIVVWQRRLVPRVLPAIAVVLAIAWIVFMAKDYWSGHLETIFGDLGRIDSVLQSSLADRVAGSSASRTTVLAVRMGVTGLLGLLALVGIVIRRRITGRWDWLTVLLAGAPGLLVAVQSYGGEILLRVLLYSLPFLAFAAAAVFAPRDRIRRLGGAALALVMVVSVPAFYVARFGNEAFERVTAGDVEAVRNLYDLAEPGATIEVIIPSLPWRFQDYAGFNYVIAKADAFAELNPADIRAAVPDDPEGSYLVINDGQLAELEQFYGLGEGWGDRLVALLDRQPWLEVAYANDSARIYRVVDGGDS